MKKVVTLIAATVVVMMSSQVNAQCIGCSQGVSPSFGTQVYSSPVQYGNVNYGTAVYNSAPVYNSGCNSCGQQMMPACGGQTCGCSTQQCAQPSVCNAPVNCRRATVRVRYRRSCNAPRYRCSTAMACNNMSSCNTCNNMPVSGGCIGCSGGVVSQPVFNGQMMNGQVINGTVVEGVQPQVDATPVPQLDSNAGADQVNPPTPTPVADGT